MKKSLFPALVLLVLLSCSVMPAFSQVVYNAYAKITAVSASTLLAVSNVNQANHTFNAGEYVIVMQMQDDVIGSNTSNTASFGDLGSIANAGKFEVAKIAAVNLSAGTPTSIALSSALSNTYNTGANASAQIITFRRLSGAAFTSTNSITGLAWDGNTGGVVAIEVVTVFTLAHSITADGLGFAGGVKNPVQFASTSCDPNFIMPVSDKWAGKGEGIYKNTNTAFSGARGKILTGGGGGNDENSGGGGGGNYTSGGMGGPGYTGGSNGCSPTVGGLGGISLNSYIGPSRVYMGGGGGGGHENNNVGTPGGAGGGIILIKTGTLTTTGSCGALSITANGLNSGNSGNDASGGAGAGGSIVFQVNSYSISSTCTLNVNSDGGTAGDVSYSVAHGAGGGGGQGTIIYSGAQPTVNVTSSTLPGNGGASCSGCTGSINGEPGNGSANSGIIVVSTGVLPVELLYFKVENRKEDVGLSWATASQLNTDHFTVERTIDFKTWSPVCTQKAAGTIHTTVSYTDADAFPVSGLSYYRLKTTDTDGKVHYSQAVDINREATGGVMIFPNPASEELNIVSVKEHALTDFTLFDLTGKAVEMTIKVTGTNKVAIDTGNLSKGLYFLKLSDAAGPGTLYKIMIR
jgi:hypothetical protein